MAYLLCPFKLRQSLQGRLWSLFKGTVEFNGKTYGEYGTIDGIKYEPIENALKGPLGDGNGIISGYNCRHRLIAYVPGSKPPTDFTEAEIKREYEIDKQQRSYENRIRQMKTEERQLRAAGMADEAKKLRKRWQKLTLDYQLYSIDHKRAYYRYRCVIDRAEEKSANIAEEKITDSGQSVDTSVNWSIINNKQYFDRFTKFVSEKKNVANAISRAAIKSLHHRDGSRYEDLFLIDARIGKEVARNVTSKEPQKVANTAEMRTLLAAKDNKTYIALHNHPESTPPSASDFNSLYKHPKIKYGVIVGHNGTVYKFTAPNKLIQKDEISIAIKHFIGLGFTIETAEAKAYESLSDKFNFRLEVLKNGR